MAQTDEKLTPAAPEDLAMSLAFALRFSGRKRFRPGGELMARITAEHLVEHLEQSGYVFMKRPTPDGSSPSRGPSEEST